MYMYRNRLGMSTFQEHEWSEGVRTIASYFMFQEQGYLEQGYLEQGFKNKLSKVYGYL
jgi:hypothetical protein